MKKVEVYLDNNGILTVSEFRKYESKYETLKVSGYRAKDLIKKICKNKILDVYENPKKDQVALLYKNCVVNLNDIDILLKKGQCPL